VTLLATLVIAGVAGGAALFLMPSTAPVATELDMRGRPVALDPGVAAADAHADADIGMRLRVPDVGLDVPVGEVDAVDGVIVPPGFTSAYVVGNRGVTPEDAASGTVYVAMHSLRDGGVGPGNSLIDVDAQSARVAPGTLIELDDTTYRVDGSALIGKNRLAQSSDVWAEVPGRLVLITCLQRPGGGASVQNVLVFATEVP